MASVVAELSYYPSGSNFNLQMGGHRDVLMIIRDFIGDHYGSGFFNVVVFRGDVGQWLLAVVANSRFNIPGVGKPASAYHVAAQRRVWRLSDRT